VKERGDGFGWGRGAKNHKKQYATAFTHLPICPELSFLFCIQGDLEKLASARKLTL
jgi:hypothetical protein